MVKSIVINKLPQDKILTIDDVRNKILQGHILDALAKIPTGSIDCCLTSPPYWALRDYKTQLVWWGGSKICEHNTLQLQQLTKKQTTPKTYAGRMGNLDGEGRVEKESSKIDILENYERLENRPLESLTSGGNDRMAIKQEHNYAYVPKKQFAYCKLCGAWLGQLGLEPTFKEYIDHLMMIFTEIKRILKPTGTCFVNLGDTYYGGGQREGQNKQATNFGLKTDDRNYVDKAVARGKQNNIQNKSLVGIPWRFAIAMIDDGWILRNDNIWAKSNGLPSPVKDRWTKNHEYFFFFTKQQKYFFKQQLEPIQSDGIIWSRNSLKGENQEQNNPRSNYGIIKKKPKSNWDNWSKKNNLGIGGKKYQGTELQQNSKYFNTQEESSYREGLHKERGSKLIEKRKHLPSQKEFVDVLREHFTIDEIISKTNLSKTTVEHWFRYDSGFSYPTKNDWETFLISVCLKIDLTKNDEILFPGLLEITEEPDEVKNTFSHYRNCRTVWNIPTKPFPGSHFAVFNENLIKGPIDAGCPVYICKACQKPRLTVYNFEQGEQLEDYQGEATKDYEEHDAQDPSETKRRILESMRNQLVGTTLTTCNCNKGFNRGIVLDPFFGSGTTGLVAKSQDKDFIGIELNPEYVKMAQKRLGVLTHRLDEYFDLAQIVKEDSQEQIIKTIAKSI